MTVPPMSTPSDAAVTRSGRVVRAALLILPAGTILFGIASFGIWWMKKTQVEERGYKYALALRRDLGAEGLQRHGGILLEVMRLPEADRLGAVAAYLESSMGAENMGYAVRRERWLSSGMELANVDVELTGRQRPREVVLVLVPFGDAARSKQEAWALATALSLAHAITGESGARTLRLAAIPVGRRDDSGMEALERMAARSREREERIMQVHVLGGPSEALLAQVKATLRAEATGTVIQALPETLDAASSLAAAQVLRTRLLQAAE